MKKHINNKVYNSDKAQRLGYRNNDLSRHDPYFFEETLYRNRAGSYFVHGSGQCYSFYGSWKGNSGGPGEDIRAYTEREAIDWSRQHLCTSEFINLWGLDDQNLGFDKNRENKLLEILTEFEEHSNVDYGTAYGKDFGESLPEYTGLDPDKEYDYLYIPDLELLAVTDYTGDYEEDLNESYRSLSKDIALQWVTNYSSEYEMLKSIEISVESSKDYKKYKRIRKNIPENISVSDYITNEMIKMVKSKKAEGEKVGYVRLNGLFEVEIFEEEGDYDYSVSRI